MLVRIWTILNRKSLFTQQNYYVGYVAYPWMDIASSGLRIEKIIDLAQVQNFFSLFYSNRNFWIVDSKIISAAIWNRRWAEKNYKSKTAPQIKKRFLQKVC